MEAIYLQSMTDFVLKTESKGYSNLDCQFFKIQRYANFLKQSLQLGFFVPCVDGKPIEYYNMEKTGGKFCKVGSEIEKEAKERVLFKGFEFEKFIDDGKLLPYYRFKKDDEYCNIRLQNRNIEDLFSEFRCSLELTENAIKQIGL